MLHYPKIPSAANCPGGKCVAFEKIDGTNLHFDWDRDFGWHAFGTRRDVFNLTEDGVAAFHAAHPGLDDCVTVFNATLADALDQVFRTHPGYLDDQEFTAFAEYVGVNSFAGQHKPDDSKRLVLFDVLSAAGFVAPFDFVRDFGHLPTPRVVFQGKFTGQLSEDVRRGKFDVEEGVVIKGGSGEELWMCKIKTLAYLERLKRSFGERWEDYWE